MSRLAHLHQRHPCRVFLPQHLPGEPPMGVLATLSGGLTGGDRIRVAVDVGEQASLSVTTQAAELIYRSTGPECLVDIDISIGAGAWMDWLPRPTILFDGSRLRRRTGVSVAAGGRLLASECIVFGRAGRGEAFATGGSLRDCWRVSRDGRPIWIDAFDLTGDIDAAFASPVRLGGAGAMATAPYVAEDAAGFLDLARSLVERAEGRAGATVVNGVLIARFLDRAAEVVRRDLDAYLGALRVAASPYAGDLPRVGHG